MFSISLVSQRTVRGTCIAAQGANAAGSSTTTSVVRCFLNTRQYLRNQLLQDFVSESYASDFSSKVLGLQFLRYTHLYSHLLNWNHCVYCVQTYTFVSLC